VQAEHLVLVERSLESQENQVRLADPVTQAKAVLLAALGFQESQDDPALADLQDLQELLATQELLVFLELILEPLVSLVHPERQDSAEPFQFLSLYPAEGRHRRQHQVLVLRSVLASASEMLPTTQLHGRRGRPPRRISGFQSAGRPS